MLKTFPDECIDSVITSPPYYQLRDYGWTGQWGLEKTYQEYLEHLIELMKECKRVLKPTGTMFINLGDSYGTISGGIRGLERAKKVGGSISKKNIIGQGFEQIKDGAVSKCLMLIPHRFAIRCIDELGLILRNDVIWAKRNGMPESVTDRFSKKHEFFFFFVKNPHYYFDLDSIRDKHIWAEMDSRSLIDGGRKSSGKCSESRYACNKVAYNELGKNPGDVSDFWDKKPYAVIDKEFRREIIEYRNLPEQSEIVEYLQKARKSKGITIDEIEEIFGGYKAHHWFEKDGSYPDKEDWIKLKDILEFDDKFDNQMTIEYEKSGLKQDNPNGKNPGDCSDFWDIPTQPSSEKHYATFNTKLIDKPIIAGSPEGGIICDPFAGTCTTLLRAMELGRKAIGIDGSKEYCTIAQKRIDDFLKQTVLGI